MINDIVSLIVYRIIESNYDITLPIYRYKLICFTSCYSNHGSDYNTTPHTGGSTKLSILPPVTIHT